MKPKIGDLVSLSALANKTGADLWETPDKMLASGVSPIGYIDYDDIALVIGSRGSDFTSALILGNNFYGWITTAFLKKA